MDHSLPQDGAAEHDGRARRAPVGPLSPALSTHLKSLLLSTTRLFQQELELARLELREKIDQLAQAALSSLFAAGLLIAGMSLLCASLTLALALTMPLWLACLLVGGAAFVVGLLIFGLVRSALQPERLVPDRTLDQLKRDMRLGKEPDV